MARKSHRKPKRGELTREMVVSTALDCLDRLGLERFSAREVARAIGVFPTALRWHVSGGRNGLLAEAAALAMSGVTPEGDAALDWRAWLRMLFHRYREAMHRHPNAAALLGAQLVSNGGVPVALVEGVLTALEAAGFRDAALRDAYNAVIAAMVGFTTLELAPEPIEDRDLWANALRSTVGTCASDTTRYPALARNAKWLTGSAFILRWESGSALPMDSGFAAYVDAFLIGLTGAE
jgi:AcrR family transcriptional regulator